MSGDIDVAYKAIGQGPLALLYFHGVGSQIDSLWEDAWTARLLHGLAAFSMIIVFDRRARARVSGLSRICRVVRRAHERSAARIGSSAQVRAAPAFGSGAVCFLPDGVHIPSQIVDTGCVRVRVYTRVSTDRQAEAGFGLRVQEQQCRRWAKANGHAIVEVFRDEGVSGVNGVEDRVGFPRRWRRSVTAVSRACCALLSIAWRVRYRAGSNSREGVGVRRRVTADAGEVRQDDADVRCARRCGRWSACSPS